MQENKNWMPSLFQSPYSVLLVVPRPVWLPWTPRGKRRYPVVLKIRVLRTKDPTVLKRNRITAAHKRKGL